MGRDSITETIKSSWEIILQQITSPAKEKVNRRTSYICPLCGHGTHGDGLTLNPKSSGGYGLKCFGSCGFSGDIIDLIGEVEHIDSYPEKLKRAGELAGVDVNTGNIREDFKPAPRSEQSYSGNEQMTGTYTPTHTHIHILIYTYYFIEVNSVTDRSKKCYRLCVIEVKSVTDRSK